MEDGDELWRGIARRLTGEERLQLADHPSPPVLHEYLQGTLAAAARIALQEHLAACVDCTQELLQLQDFLAAEVTAEERAQATRQWPPFRTRLIAEGVLSDRDRPPARPWQRWRIGPPSAATRAFAALALALAMTTAYLALQVHSLRQPQANVAVVDLVPGMERSRPRGGALLEVVIPRRADRVLLALNAPPAVEHGAYAVEIHRGAAAGAEPLWRRVVTGRTASHNFNVDLPGSFLADGTYLLRVAGIERDGERALWEYRLRIRHER